MIDALVHAGAGEQPRRAGDERPAERLAVFVDAGVLHEPPAEGVVIVPLLDALERDTAGGRDLLDLPEQVVDRLVTGRRDTNTLACRDQGDDETRTGPRLARSGRTLDEEVTGIERGDERLLLGEVER